MKPWIWLLLAVAALAVMVTPMATKVLTRGPLIGPDAKAGEDGIVPGDPRELARQAGLSPDTYALARMIASEHGSGTVEEKTAVAWAARNEARARKVTLLQLLTKARKGDGHFGSQWRGAWASTAKPPRKHEVDVARAVEAAPLASDPTKGARRFFSPQAQDALFKRATVPGYTKDAAAVEQKWSAEGWRKVAVAGLNPRELTLFRKVT